MNIEIVICVEQGYLENMAKLFVYSLRTFGGKYKDAPIYCYQPRKQFWYKVSKETIRFFEQYNAHFIDEYLNKKYNYYGIANKVLACAHREKRSTADAIIFSDTDIFFLREPTMFGQFEDCDLILRPEDRVGIATRYNSNDKNAEYWKKAYNLLNAEQRQSVRTTVDDVEVLEYYNAGHIAAKNNENTFFQIFLENFEKLIASKITPKNKRYFIDQIVLPITASQQNLSIRRFDKYYNCPINFIDGDRIANEDYHVNNFKKIVTAHYHSSFKFCGVDWQKKLFDETAAGTEIRKKCIEYEVAKNFPSYQVKLIDRNKIRMKNIIGRIISAYHDLEY